MVELRLDEHMNQDQCLDLCIAIEKIKPVLLTIRTDREGGTWTISDAERVEIFKRFAPHVSYMDLEIKSRLFADNPRSTFPADTKIVASYHDYEATPAKGEILELIKSASEWGADVAKLALFSNCDQDVELLKEVLQEVTEQPLCLIGMGEKGVCSRSDFAALGSVLTYGYLDDSAAPGQLSALNCEKFSADYSKRSLRALSSPRLRASA